MFSCTTPLVGVVWVSWCFGSGGGLWGEVWPPRAPWFPDIGGVSGFSGVEVCPICVFGIVSPVSWEGRRDFSVSWLLSRSAKWVWRLRCGEGDRDLGCGVFCSRSRDGVPASCEGDPDPVGERSLVGGGTFSPGLGCLGVEEKLRLLSAESSLSELVSGRFLESAALNCALVCLVPSCFPLALEVALEGLCLLFLGDGGGDPSELCVSDITNSGVFRAVCRVFVAGAM